ncbi:MAG TPA: MBL fold metallo-hydrolase [Anaerolineales bacterium]|nr:MBL fold metallo-hydrolase [Anaerolineales bacterium]HQX15603.1 MBL fold metallo-hydrolase [Anaerolineales bacterium]
MPNELRVKFWGVRGSYPTPGAETVKYGGNTASVEIRAGERTIILDAGTGIIPLGRELARTKRAGEILLLLSHLHHDHTQGFPFFVPAYMPSTRLHIYGPDGTHESLKGVLERNQSSETFPVGLRDMASSKDIQAVRESQIVVWDGDGVRAAESGVPVGEEAVVIRIHKSYAHPGGVYVYRITWRGKSVVYATDTEGYVGTDKRLVKFAKDADVLIHDAQYLDEHYWGQLEGFPATQGFGHSTVTMASEVAASARTGQLVLFHHDPAYTDDMLAGMERTAKSLFADSVTAYEGLEIDLTPSPSPKRREEWKAVQYAQNG